MLIKTSVVCLLFILYMLGFYYRNPHIPIKSTKVFQVLNVVALLNAVFDLITLYTVNHRDQIPEMINLVAHVIYLLSILCFVALLFLYTRSCLGANLKPGRAVRIVQSIPFLLSTAGILVLPITYIHGETTDYSLGPKAYALYGSVVFYLILILYYCLRYWGILDMEKRIALILAVPIYTVISFVQILNPETLVAVVASTLILLGLILSNENTEKYLDEKTPLFNRYSFEIVLDEFDFERQSIIVGILCFCKTENSLDWEQDNRLLQDIYQNMKSYHLWGYRISENGVVFVGSTKDKTQMVLDEIKCKIEDKYGKDHISIETKMIADDDAATGHSCMTNIIAFCTEAGRHFAYIDYLTHIYNRNALERDLILLQENGNGYYIIADLNDLKLVNDTIGHSAGDELLQSFAGMLAGIAGMDGKAYRQGGDEFAVLYRKDAQEFVNRLAEQCRKDNLTRNIPISYAIGYCGISKEDYMNIADQMMYADKRRIKEQRSNV